MSRAAGPPSHAILLEVSARTRLAAHDLIDAWTLMPDRESGRALDDFVDHLLDALRMVDAEAGELAGLLGTARTLTAGRSDPRSR